MTASVFLGITGAVLAALKAGTPLHPGVGSVVRGRRLVAPAGDKWRVTINAKRHAGSALDMSGADLQWDTLVGLDISIRAASDEDAEAAMDPLIQSVWQRLTAMTLPVGVLAATIDPQITLDFDEVDQTVATATLVLRVTHVTRNGSLLAA